MANRRRKQSSASPVAAVAIVLLVLTAVFGVRLYHTKYAYSRERADLNEYYGVRGADDVPIVLCNNLSDYRAKLIDGVYYMDFRSVHEILNRRFYYGEQDGMVYYCLPTERVQTEVGSSTMRIPSQGDISEDYPLTRMVEDELYLALDFVQRFSNFTYTGYTEPNRIQMDNAWDREFVAEVKKDQSIRVSGGIKSEVVTDVKRGDIVTILETMDNWSKVKTEDAYIGYIENKRLEEAYERTPQVPDVYTEPDYPTKRLDGKVCLVWHNVAYVDGNATIYDLLNNTRSINVVSPTWFSVSDDAGNMTDIASANYVSDMRYRGIQVWPSVNNFTATGGSYVQGFLKTDRSRRAVIDRLLTAADNYGFEGINVDFEGILDENGYDFIEFVRELSIECRKKGLILSVDNYVPYNFNDHYDLMEQGVFADYVIIMGYDEHYAGSPEPGSVASIGYVKRGIEQALLEVPKEKVINGVPFYTRIWTSKAGATTSIALGMQATQNYISERGMSIIWNETAGQNYAEATFSDNSVVRVWIEDAESIRLKLGVMSANEIAGVAAWQLGFETPDIWDEIAAYMSR